MEVEITLEDAIEVLREIATGDKEIIAFKEVEYALGRYRALYEGTMKKLERYRDVAAKPDVFIPDRNKDKYEDLQTAMREYNELDKEGRLPFEEWLFAEIPHVDSSRVVA